MFLLTCTSGLQITEKEVGYWDNVPKDIEIKVAAISIGRPNQKPFIVHVEGYDEICCGKTGRMVPGIGAEINGNVVFGIKGDQVTEFFITTGGVKLSTYHRDKLTLRPDCLRRMAA